MASIAWSVPFAAFGAAVLAVWLVLYTTVPAAWKAMLASGSFFGAFLMRHPGIARWFDARRARLAGWSAFAPVAAIVAGGLAVTAAAGLAFLELAERVAEQNPELLEIDGHVHRLARAQRSDGATVFFEVCALVGSGPGLTVIVAAASAALLVQGRKTRALYLLFTSAAGGLLNAALKLHYQRARPDLSEAVRAASGFSFPSGHAMGSCVVFAALAYLALRHFERWRAGSLAVSAALVATLAISLSRIYLGVHWVSDITAGVAAGALCVTTTTVAYEALRYVLRARKGGGVSRPPASPA